jgi:serine/threonine protein phosphatase PrpC
MFELVWAAATHAGRVRARNEDAILTRPPLFVIADGMGGHDAGDVASSTAVNVLAALADRGELSRSAVLDAVRTANRQLAVLGHRTGRTMGTTMCGLAALTIHPAPHLILFNVGDSRAYRLRTGALDQLTHDHSVVQELVDAGTIRPDEARHHPRRNVVTRALGTEGYLPIDWWTVSVDPGDRFLLTTDGLTGELEDPDIGAILAGAPDPRTAADALVDAALWCGGRDNVSVIVVEVAGTTDGVASDAIVDPLDADTCPRTGWSADPATDAAGPGPGPDRVAGPGG